MSVSGRVPVWGFPYFRNSHLQNLCFRKSHLRNFSRIQAPLNQTPLRLPPNPSQRSQFPLSVPIFSVFPYFSLFSSFLPSFFFVVLFSIFFPFSSFFSFHSFQKKNGETPFARPFCKTPNYFGEGRTHFQTPNSVSFFGSRRVLGKNSVSSFRAITCVLKRTHGVFRRTHPVSVQCKLTEFALWKTAFSK